MAQLVDRSHLAVDGQIAQDHSSAARVIEFEQAVDRGLYGHTHALAHSHDTLADLLLVAG